MEELQEEAKLDLAVYGRFKGDSNTQVPSLSLVELS
jgi:hypothetical protein